MWNRLLSLLPACVAFFTICLVICILASLSPRASAVGIEFDKVTTLRDIFATASLCGLRASGSAVKPEAAANWAFADAEAMLERRLRNAKTQKREI